MKTFCVWKIVFSILLSGTASRFSNPCTNRADGRILNKTSNYPRRFNTYFSVDKELPEAFKKLYEDYVDHLPWKYRLKVEIFII